MINPFEIVKPLTSYQQEAEEFEARKRQRMLEEQVAQGKLSMLPFEQQKIQAEAKALQEGRGGNIPATIQIANEMQRALASGDTTRYNMLNQVHKTMDRGLQYDSTTGQYIPMQGYGQAIGSIAADKSGMSRQAEKTVDLRMNPQILGEEQGAKGLAELQTGIEKRSQQSQGNLDVINEILTPDQTGKTLLDKATGSGIGALWASGKSIVGESDESTQANAELQVYAGKLLNNIPRMEGPQSDADLKSYKEQAGKIGEPTIPAKDKIAALRAVQNLSQKYSIQNQKTNDQDQYAPAGIQIDMPSTAPRKGDVVDGYMFNGGNPADQKSWKKVK